MRKRRLKAEGEHMGDVGKIRKKRSAALRPGRFGCFRPLLLTLLFWRRQGFSLTGTIRRRTAQARKMRVSCLRMPFRPEA